ncbi:DUF4834 family protein [Gaetbulibacter saemankumensis]|uniref:DUF4834 family protein n=1 Tax=Gaetbulibacter saemankumensis TaxID=311208 RepID=UPI0004854E58|nr:DUF4834 family protein [Gaetbulibacter saemankumensis]
MLHQASVPGFLRTILIILLIYYGLKVLSRLFAPFLIKYAAKKAEEKFGGQFSQFQQKQQESMKKEGEVSIDKMPNKKSSNKELGEYVDYEEID